MQAELPKDEQRRLAALERLKLLDTESEERFDRLTRMAAAVIGTPIAMVNLVAKDRQFTKSAAGMDRLEIGRAVSFCAQAILSDEVMTVPDAQLDERFADNPFVQGEPRLRFYAGRPVHSPDGQRIGTVCVVDLEPRTLTAEQLAALDDIGSLVESEFERVDLVEALEQNQRLERRFSSVFDESSEALMLVEPDGRSSHSNDGLSRLLGYPADTIDQSNFQTFVHPDDLDLVIKTVSLKGDDDAPRMENIDARFKASDGSWRWFEIWVHDLTDDPSVGAFLLSARDVNDRIEFASVQQEANDRLDAALRTAKYGFVEFDAEGRAVDFNDAVGEVVGINQLDFDKFWDLRRHLVDRNGKPLDVDYTPISDAVFSGKHLTDEIMGVRVGESGYSPFSYAGGDEGGDGGFRWLSINTAPLAVGEEQHTIMSVHDVTQARILERELAREHRRYELIFEHASDILAVIDDTGQVMFSSPATQKVLGESFDHRAPGGLLAQIHPDDRNMVQDIFYKVLRNEWDPEQRVVLRVAATDGDWTYLEATATNLLLESSIGGILVTARDVTSTELLTQALAHQALRDPLTGIFNRRSFGEGAERSLARAARSGDHVGLLVLDLDGFKGVNDQHGHAVGDAVLIEVANRLTSMIRAGDMVGRFGGDEFVVVLEPVSGESDAESMANRVLHIVSQPIDVDGIELVCAPSIGLAVSRGETDHEPLLARADAAMYEAKRNGGRRVAIG